MTATEILNDSPEYKSGRRLEMQICREYFAKQLFHIYCLAPHPGYKLDLITGQLELMPLADAWKDKIEQIEKLRDEYLKTNFPEFYVD